MDSSYYITLAVAILKVSVAQPYSYARARLAYTCALKAICVVKETVFDDDSLDIRSLEDLAELPHLRATSYTDWVYTHTIQEIRNELHEWEDTDRSLCAFVENLAHGMSNVVVPVELMHRFIEAYATHIECKSWHALLTVE